MVMDVAGTEGEMGRRIEGEKESGALTREQRERERKEGRRVLGM